MHREPRHLLLVQQQLDRHALIHFVQQHGTPDVADLFVAQQADTDQLRQGRVQRLVVADLFANQFDIEGRQIVREHHAMPVQNQASAGRDGLGANAVALR